MKTAQIEGKNVWQVTAWWDKTVYVCGWIFVVLFTMGFIKGFFGA